MQAIEFNSLCRLIDKVEECSRVDSTVDRGSSLMVNA